MITVMISVPDSLKEFLDQAVKQQGFHNVSDYLSSLLLQAQAKQADARLEALLLEGLTSGEDIPVNAQFWARLRADLTQVSAIPK